MALPESIHDRALDQIRYIRSAVESGSSFTAVPGLGGVAMGVVGLAATAVAAPETDNPQRWLTVWLIAAAIAVTIGVVSMIKKSREAGPSLVSTPARRFALAFFPALAAGGVLTLALVQRQAWDLLPPVWLLCYGVAVTGGGALSVRIVPFMGLGLLLIGAVAFIVPFHISNYLLGLGFGVVQIAAGVVIMRRYGG